MEPWDLCQQLRFHAKKLLAIHYKSSFGGSVVPTKSRQAPIAPGFNPPVGDVEPSKFLTRMPK